LPNQVFVSSTMEPNEMVKFLGMVNEMSKLDGSIAYTIFMQKPYVYMIPRIHEQHTQMTFSQENQIVPKRPGAFPLLGMLTLNDPGIFQDARESPGVYVEQLKREYRNLKQDLSISL